MNERYPGTNGSTHGDKNDTSPAANAIGRVSTIAAHQDVQHREQLVATQQGAGDVVDDDSVGVNQERFGLSGEAVSAIDRTRRSIALTASPDSPKRS